MSIAGARGQPAIDRNRALALEEQQRRLELQTARSTKINQALDDTAGVIDGIIQQEILKPGGGNINDPALQNAIAPLMKEGLSLAQKASEVDGVDRVAIFNGRVNQSLNSATAQQKAKQEEEAAISAANAEDNRKLTKAKEQATDVNALKADTITAEQTARNESAAPTHVSVVMTTGPETGNSKTLLFKNGVFTDGNGNQVNPNTFTTSVSFEGTVDEATGLTKKETGVSERNIISATAGLQRIQKIKSEFDSEFLTFRGRIKSGVLDFIEKAGAKLDPEQKDFQTKFSKFRSRVVGALNERVRALSGAQVTEKEAERIKEEIFNKDDSPSQFLAKLEILEENNIAIINRERFFLNNGVSKEEYDKALRESTDDLVVNGRTMGLETFKLERQQAINRFNTLRNEGKSTEEAKSIVQQETGFLK